MKNPILTLACLALLTGAAYSLTFQNNTPSEKSLTITFTKGGGSHEIVGIPENGGTTSIAPDDPILRKTVASITWYDPKKGALVNCTGIKRLKLSDLKTVSLTRKVKANCDVTFIEPTLQ